MKEFRFHLQLFAVKFANERIIAPGTLSYSPARRAMMLLFLQLVPNMATMIRLQEKKPELLQKLPFSLFTL